MNYTFSNFPFIRYTIGLIAGIVSYLVFKKDLNAGLPILIVLGLLYCLIAALQKGQQRDLLGIIGFLFLFILGYFNAFKADIIKDKNHFSKIKDILFYKAAINNLVEDKPNSWKVTVEVKSVSTLDSEIKCLGQVLLYMDKKSVAKPKYGDILLIKGNPNIVEVPKNPFEFDYKNYLSNQGIYHQQYLKDTSFVSIGHSVPNMVSSWAVATNNYCDSLFTKYIPKHQELAVANAMILGLRDDIDNDLIQAYSAAGAIHVLSVSGLHVGVIYLVLVWFFGFLKKIKFGGKAIFLAVILAILWFYAAITGFSSPVLRSTFMFSLILIAETINRQHNSYNTVSISAFCLLVYNPFFLLNVGFLLSYLAVFGMIQIQPILNPLIIIDKRKNIFYWLSDRLWKVSTVAIAAQIATLPITIYFFHQFPNYFLLANPVVILLSSVVLIGGLAFLVIVALANLLHLSVINQYLGSVIQWIIKLLNDSVLFTEQLPGAISKYLYVSFYEMLVLYFLFFCLLSLIHTKNYIWVRFALMTTCFLIGLNIYNFVKTEDQNIVCLQAIPKGNAVSVFVGKKVTLFADETFLNDRKNIGFRLNNQFAARGVIDVRKVAWPNSNSFQVWKGKSYLFLESAPDLAVSDSNAVVVDFLIISNKKIRYLKDIKDKIKFRYLILDGNLSQFYTNRFQLEAAQDGVSAYSLIKDGALIL